MLSRLTVLFFLATLMGSFGASSKSKTASFEQVQPLFAKYCYNCHGDEKKKGDLSLQAFKSEADALKEEAVWEKVLQNVKTKEMPPENKPQPSDAERELIAQWIDSKVLNCDCSKSDPGRVTIRRLNRNEYNNTIRDLVGIDFQPAANFPTDDTGYGFDNIGDVLSLSPVLFEKYVAASAKIIDEAIVTHQHTNAFTAKFLGSDMKATGAGRALDTGGFKMEKEGRLHTSYFFPRSASYNVQIRAWGDQAGGEYPKLRIRLDEKIIKVFNVQATQSQPETFELSLDIPSGKHDLAFSYINNYNNPNDPPGERDRNLAVEWVEIHAPAGPQEYPDTHKRIFFVSPKSTRDEPRCAEQIVGKFATRAFRRPVTTDELSRLISFYKSARKDGENFESAVSLSLQAVLVSPHFLFRGEVQANPDNPRKIYPVDEFALASRLSYFLWSSMPDDELFALAEKKKLRANLESQVRRMLQDKKAEAFVQNFVGQWLQLRNLQVVQPDPKKFPEFDDDLREAMKTETELVFSYILRENRSALELLDSDYTFVNEKLAKHYGIENVSNEKFERVALTGDQRGSVMTHASVLTLTSNPTRTSPVKRGKWVLENLLGYTPPPPPPNVPELPDEKKSPLKGTLRERTEQHRANPDCISCHLKMDPIGFGLENFDAVGAWRKKDGENPVDSSGELFSGETFNGPAELKHILATNKKDEFIRCLSEKMLIYALGRGLERYDKCAVDEICKNLAQNNYRQSQLILDVVNSTPFQMRRGETPVKTAAR